MSAKETTRVHLQTELEGVGAAIPRLEELLRQRDEELAALQANKEEEEGMQQLQQKCAQMEKNPKSIAPEDALDTIMRLENTLKVMQRRNVLLDRENGTQRKISTDKVKVLKKVSDDCDQIIDLTGWHADKKASVGVEELVVRIEEMERLENTLLEEQKTARVIVRKKEQLVEALSQELDAKKEKEESLYQLYNDIRVKDRDVQEARARVDELQRAHAKRDSALETVLQDRDMIAVDCLTQDNQYLRDEVVKQKQRRSEQERVLRALQDRANVLTSRLDTINEAIVDLSLEQDVGAAVGKESVVVAAPEGDLYDMERIAPADEKVGAELFELLHRDLEALKSAFNRKDILVLEKEASVSALQEKFEASYEEYRTATLLQQQSKEDKIVEMQQLHSQLEQQHKEYRQRIDKMLSDNLNLKNSAPRWRPESSAPGAAWTQYW